WDRAARLISVAGFSHAGQSCISTQRVYVHEEVADAFSTALAKRVDDLKVGDPLDEDTDVSALITTADRDRVKAWIDEAVAGGAEVLAGGDVRDGLLRPTVLRDVPPGVRGPGDDRAPAGHRAAVGRVARPATRGPSTAVAPMLATLTDRLPRDPDAWGFEFKWDGVRAIVGVDERGVTATSRNRLDITGRYPELDGLAAALAGRTAVLDGEVAAPGAQGRPSFQRPPP